MMRLYCQPRCRTQESFDSLTVIHVVNKETLVVFQIPMASTYKVNPGGVSEIVQTLPKTMKQVLIIFLVPEDRIDNHMFPEPAPAEEILQMADTSTESSNSCSYSPFIILSQFSSNNRPSRYSSSIYKLKYQAQ